MTTQMTPAALIENYIVLRNRVTEIKERHQKEIDQFTTVMQAIENELLEHLATANLESFKSDKGTAYKQTATSAKVTDWEQALEYIKTTGRWEMLEARVAKTAALTAIEETGKPVPGVKINQAIVLRVRSA